MTAMETWDEMLARADRESGTTHRGGVPWYRAPMPRRWHRCSAQTTGYVRFQVFERCACGAARWDERGSWIERNTRAKSDGMDPVRHDEIIRETLDGPEE